jgi:hypothetical protein
MPGVEGGAVQLRLRIAGMPWYTMAGLIADVEFWNERQNRTAMLNMTKESREWRDRLINSIEVCQLAGARSERRTRGEGAGVAVRLAFGKFKEGWLR